MASTDWSRQKKVNTLEDRTMGITESEEQKEKRLKRNEQSLRDLWDAVKWHMLVAVPEEEEKSKEAEKIFKEMMTENFPNLMKDINIREAQMNSKNPH